jgi:beta-glucosidase
VSDGHAKMPVPERELKGFARVMLGAGETKAVSVTLDARAFASYDVAKKSWVIEPGKFGIEVGDSVEALPLVGAVELTREAAKSAF